MLKHQPWIKFAPEMLMEWKQARDEGRDVLALKGICEEVAKKTETQDMEETAKALKQRLDNAPQRKDYPFVEPSDLAGIQNAKAKPRHDFRQTLSDASLKEKLAGAWIGRISGCLLGKPVEGWRFAPLTELLKESHNYPMTRYMMTKEFPSSWNDKVDLNRAWADRLNGMAPIDDDTNYTVFALKLVETYGKDFIADDVLESWMNWIPYLATCTAERVAYRNASMGMTAPQTATTSNPYREFIGAQIRGDFFGYINPGDPSKAAEMAYRDACISHIKNGIYGEMLIAAMIAAAAVSDDILTVIEAGLDEIPALSRLHQELTDVLSWHMSNQSYDEVIAKIHQRYDEHDGYGWCHTNSNAMIVVTALLYGNKDFTKTLGMSVQPAFDTDCNGATAGSILGMMIGEKAIPSQWTAPYGKRLETSIIGMNIVTVEELVNKTFSLIKK